MDCGHIVGGEAAVVFTIVMAAMVALTAMIVTVILTLAYCRIFSKAGFCWAWGLLMLMPIVNMVVLLVLAFSDWPVLKELRRLRQQSGAGNHKQTDAGIAIKQEKIMSPERPQRVSVIEPIAPAIEQVKVMLFSPFDLSKWFIVGFCAWLAYLGQGGSSSFNYRTGHHNSAPDFPAVKEAVLAHLPWIIIGVAVVIPMLIIIGLILCWLRSRGQFMFVHCIAGNKAEVAVPWGKFAGQGNSLFLFRIIFGLIAIVAVGLPIALAVVALMALQAAGLSAAGVTGLCVAIFVAVIVALAVVLVSKFTDDFVVPIMFLRTAGCLAGWREFLAIIACNKARFVLYILFQLVISLAIFFIITTICLAGCCCCCASALLFVPYVGTVILLPLFIFKRAYSLFYLRQFGAQFNVFGGQVL